MLRRPTTTDFKPRRLPWKRSLQSLLTPEQMNIAVQRETARADRNGAQFALVMIYEQKRNAGSKRPAAAVIEADSRAADLELEILRTREA